MGNDLDALDEIFADEGVKKARPVGKFQPKAKAKFRPTKKDSAAPSVSSSNPAQSIDTTAVGLTTPAEAPKPSENCANVSDDNKSSCASLEKLVAENAVLIGLESLDDIPQSNSLDIEGSALPTELLNSDNAEGHGHPFPSSVEDAIHSSDVSKCNEISADQDSLASGEPMVSSGDGCGELPNEELHREEMDIMNSLCMSASTTKSEQRRGKFLPKQKKQKQKKLHETNESCSLGSQSVQSENNSAEKDSGSAFQPDDMLNLSDLGITHTLPTGVTTEIPLAEGLVNLMETTNVVPEVPAKLTSRRAKTQTQTASDPSPQQQPASAFGEGNELRRSSRKRKAKTNLCELVDEDEDEVVAGGEISDENPIDSAMEEENVLNEESQVENESKKKKMKQKDKKPEDGKEKPTRKRNKAEGAPDKGADAKPKKFSHSTRRRRVNKDLLAIPEDEIEYQKVPLRDLLVLADYKERQMKRDEAAAAAATATKQSNGNSSNRNNEDEAFNLRGDGEYDDERDEPQMEDTTVFFNYHSHMDRTPVTRWSKQETEVFYEAVRQFGTDLSMIQQLFPDRTRRQVKLKYKKEEKQHPLRLHEALTTRSTDHSHFERVIQHLKEMAAKENENDENDDTVGNVEDEGTSNVDKKEEAKDEEIEEAIEDVADEAEVEVESPSKIEDNDEDDQFLWTYSST